MARAWRRMTRGLCRRSSRRALAGEPLKIAGDGTQRDSFCYVDDMLEALIRYMRIDIFPGPWSLGIRYR